MIGIDLVSIERVRNMIDRFGDRAVARFLSDQEIALCGGKAETIAGFWAAKEAVSKALGTGIGSDLGFLDITISKSNRGQPAAALSIDAARRFGIKNIAVSISHERSYAIAAAITPK